MIIFDKKKDLSFKYKLKNNNNFLCDKINFRPFGTSSWVAAVSITIWDHQWALASGSEHEKAEARKPFGLSYFERFETAAFYESKFWNSGNFQLL